MRTTKKWFSCIDCDKGPETFFSTHDGNQLPSLSEFMVSSIFFVVLIFLDPLVGEFTLMEVFF